MNLRPRSMQLEMNMETKDGGKNKKEHSALNDRYEPARGPSS
jgi:hypothetical protein